MAGQDWSIMIIPQGGSATFQPDVPGSKPGQPLQAQDADLVSWNNKTGKNHWPWAIDPTTQQPFASADAAKSAKMYLSDEVPAWQSSSPAYVTAAPTSGSTTINYICKLHDGEKGQIVVSAS